LEKNESEKNESEMRKMKDFWDITATRFGQKDGLKAVLHPSSKGLLNWYTDFVQKNALKKTFRSLSGKTVLDIGCGVGRWTTILSKTSSNIVGIDLSKQMLKNAKLRNTREKAHAQFVLASATQLPFADHTFDSILSVTVLQHITKEALFRSAVVEILRTIKSGGKAVLLEYNYATKIVSNQFPTVAHNYQEHFKNKGNALMVEIQGVDLSFFLKPLTNIVRKRGKYRDQLEGEHPSSRYLLFAATFYIFISVGCVLSLPLDLAFRNLFKSYSEHEILIFSVNNSQ
jgi:ubiquinone/menaquinone biosynthesis C-methylase UbiE